MRHINLETPRSRPQQHNASSQTTKPQPQICTQAAFARIEILAEAPDPLHSLVLACPSDPLRVAKMECGGGDLAHEFVVR